MIVTDCVAMPPALVAEQVRRRPLVSVMTELGSQPVVAEIGDSGSLSDQLTRTSLLYQRLLTSEPAIDGVMTGGVVSGGGVSVNGIG